MSCKYKPKTACTTNNTKTEADAPKQFFISRIFKMGQEVAFILFLPQVTFSTHKKIDLKQLALRFFILFYNKTLTT